MNLLSSGNLCLRAEVLSFHKQLHCNDSVLFFSPQQWYNIREGKVSVSSEVQRTFTSASTTDDTRARTRVLKTKFSRLCQANTIYERARGLGNGGIPT